MSLEKSEAFFRVKLPILTEKIEPYESIYSITRTIGLRKSRKT